MACCDPWHNGFPSPFCPACGCPSPNDQYQCGPDGVRLNLYGGPKKRDIIQRAYSYCGQASYEFELSPEEYNAGLRAMNDQMAVLGPLTGYNLPTYGDGSPEDESGLRAEDIVGAAYYVAKLLAQQIGKDLKTNDVAERGCSMFLARCSPVPEMGWARGTIRGAGNRWQFWRSPFLPTGERRRGDGINNPAGPDLLTDG